MDVATYQAIGLGIGGVVFGLYKAVARLRSGKTPLVEEVEQKDTCQPCKKEKEVAAIVERLSLLESYVMKISTKLDEYLSLHVTQNNKQSEQMAGLREDLGFIRGVIEGRFSRTPRKVD